MTHVDDFAATLVESVQDDCDDIQPYGPGTMLMHRDGRAFLVQVKLAEVDADLVGFGGFHLDPGDSAALLKLREAIDDHLPEYQPDADVGNYEGVVRKAGRICKAAGRWRDADEDINTPPGGTLLDDLADAIDEARGCA